MNDITIDIVCPVYKGYKYLKPLVDSFYTQSGVIINKIVLAITDSEDEEMDLVREFVKENNIVSFEVKAKDFSHSLTREKAIRDYCASKYIVMLSQDIKLTNNNVFYNLVSSLVSNETVYNYARQVCTYKSIERYIREKNYPKESLIVSKDDVDRLQLMAFFSSDACSAYNRDIFIELGGYGGYDVMMNEDQLYSKIILDNGYKKKYCANAIVEHSHRYTFKQLYKRYYESGKFYKAVKVFDSYKSFDSGVTLALYVLRRAIIRFDIIVLFRWLPDMFVRYYGMKRGRKSNL